METTTATNTKTRLDLILDTVRRGEHEVTFDCEGYTAEQIEQVVAVAKGRGLHTSCDGRFVLVREF